MRKPDGPSYRSMAICQTPATTIPRADIAMNGTPSARVSAAIALLDRAYGKPPQFNTGDPGNFRKAIDMTDDELASIVGRAKLTVV